MSYCTSLNVKFKSQRCLVRALKAMGYSPIVHEEPVTLGNRWGETAQAEIIVPCDQFKNDQSSDLGFLKTETGEFVPVADEMALVSNCFSFVSLQSQYARAVVYVVSEEQGYTIEEEILEDGSFQLKVVGLM